MKQEIHWYLAVAIWDDQTGMLLPKIFLVKSSVKRFFVSKDCMSYWNQRSNAATQDIAELVEVSVVRILTSCGNNKDVESDGSESRRPR